MPKRDEKQQILLNDSLNESPIGQIIDQELKADSLTILRFVKFLFWLSIEKLGNHKKKLYI